MKTKTLEPSINHVGQFFLFVLLMTSLLFAHAQTTYSADHIFEDDVILGNGAAPITIIVYSSPSCAECRTFFKSYYPKLQSQYLDKGHARIVLREIPTGHTALSQVGSLIARCSAEDKGVSGYVDVFVRYMPGLPPPPSQITHDLIYEFAGRAGFDKQAATECIQRKHIKSAFDRNSKHAYRTLGIQNAPTFILNGEITDIRKQHALLFREDHRLFQALDFLMADLGYRSDGLSRRLSERSDLLSDAETLGIHDFKGPHALEDVILIRLQDIARKRDLNPDEQTILTEWLERYDPNWAGNTQYFSIDPQKKLDRARSFFGVK